MSKKTLVITSVIVLVLISFLILGKKQGWFGKEDLKEVEIKKLTRLDITEKVSATGKIQPEIEVKLSSEVSGEIIELPVVEGQQVKKGDLLVKINPDIYQSNLSRSQATLQNARAGLDQADATLREAKASYERNKQLFEKGIISKADWDKAVSAYEVAQANKQSAYYSVQSASATVNEASDNLNRTTIYAPMSGTISKLDVELGERVVGTQQMAGTEILRVANLNNMEVEVDVNENDIVKVQIGDSAIVEVDAYLKKQFKGLVTEIANSADGVLTADQVTNFKVKVRILEESYQDLMEGKPEHYSPFRPGMTATVDIITDKRNKILGVPISSVVIKTDTSCTKSYAKKEDKVEGQEKKKFECVFVKVGDQAKLRVIETGIQDETNIEVISGLDEDEEIITGPYTMVSRTLDNCDKVTAKKANKPKEVSEDKE